MEYTLAIYLDHGANLGVPYVGVVKYVFTYSTGNPNNNLDNPRDVRHHKVTTP